MMVSPSFVSAMALVMVWYFAVAQDVSSPLGAAGETKNVIPPTVSALATPGARARASVMALPAVIASAHLTAFRMDK
jgi:hypothetical protein